MSGPLQVVGDDTFELDTDDPDNVACEEPSSGDSGRGSDDDTPSGGVASGYGPVASATEGRALLPVGVLGAGLGLLALVGLGVAGARHAG